MLFKKNKNIEHPFPLNPTKIVNMMNVFSEEVYKFEDDTQMPVLQDISLLAMKGDCWGIVGDEAFEVELLLEIIGNVRPYGSGKCVLVERGMMRKKRRILPHVFFIQGGDTPIPNMSVIEYLMFATDNSSKDSIERQEIFLELMLKSEFYQYCLTPIKYLSMAERSLITLIASGLSDCILVIFSVVWLTYDEKLIEAIGTIAKWVCAQGKTLIIGTKNPDLVQSACDHAGFLIDGRLTHAGTIDEVTSSLDKRRYIITNQNPVLVKELIEKELPMLLCEIHDNTIYVYDNLDAGIEPGALYKVLANASIDVESIKVSSKSVRIAFLEASDIHDI